jgi:N-acetylglucosaminyl-diphospho-decaprenol L-rhamnosyltransferase
MRDGDSDFISKALAEKASLNRVHFYPETTNHGFGRGNNVILRKLALCTEPPDYVFLLNPDAVLENEAIAILADFLDAHPDAACAGAEIRQPGGAAPVAAAFRFPGLTSILSSSVNFGPLTRLLEHHTVALPPTSEPTRVDWVAGAAVMARLKAWQDVDFFDDTYFLYYEEVDLMLQTSRAGGEIWYVPDAKVCHREGAATGVRSGELTRKRRPVYLYASWRHYFTKNHGRAYALTGAVVWLFGGALGMLIARLRGHHPHMPLNYAGDILRLVIVPLLKAGR